MVAPGYAEPIDPTAFGSGIQGAGVAPEQASAPHLVAVRDDIPHNRYVLSSEFVDGDLVTQYADMSYQQDLLVFELREAYPPARMIFPKHLLDMLSGQSYRNVVLCNTDEEGNRREGARTELSPGVLARRVGDILVRHQNTIATEVDS